MTGRRLVEEVVVPCGATEVEQVQLVHAVAEAVPAGVDVDPWISFVEQHTCCRLHHRLPLVR